MSEYKYIKVYTGRYLEFLVTENDFGKWYGQGQRVQKIIGLTLGVEIKKHNDNTILFFEWSKVISYEYKKLPDYFKYDN